jgi:undecaprenyl-diphosphatase
MATPVVAGAGLFEALKVIRGSEVKPDLHLIVIGFVAAAISGLLAIRFMLAFLRRQSVNSFVVYRVLLAAVVFVVLLSPHGA